MVLRVKRVGPVGESLFSKRPILVCPALAQPSEVPAPRIWMADHKKRSLTNGSSGRSCFAGPPLRLGLVTE